jgi:hypothetical protein
VDRSAIVANAKSNPALFHRRGWISKLPALSHLAPHAKMTHRKTLIDMEFPLERPDEP